MVLSVAAAAACFVLCLAVAVPGSLGQNTDFANNFETCVTNSVPLNTCLNNTLEELRVYMPTGIPSINVQKMEPLEIPMLDFSNKKREGALNILPLNVSVQFRNVVTRGLSSFHTNDINADLNRRVIFMSLTVPRLTITGKYRAAGIIGFFRITGEGSFDSQLDGVTGEGHARIVPVTKRNGETRISIADTNLDFNIARSNLVLKSDQNRDLFEAVSGFINANSDILINQLKPEIKTRMKVMVERTLNAAFKKIPAEKVLRHLDVPGLSGGAQQGPRSTRGSAVVAPAPGPSGISPVSPPVASSPMSSGLAVPPPPLAASSQSAVVPPQRFFRRRG